MHARTGAGDQSTLHAVGARRLCSSPITGSHAAFYISFLVNGLDMWYGGRRLAAAG